MLPPNVTAKIDWPRLCTQKQFYSKIIRISGFGCTTIGGNSNTPPRRILIPTLACAPRCFHPQRQRCQLILTPWRRERTPTQWRTTPLTPPHREHNDRPFIFGLICIICKCWGRHSLPTMTVTSNLPPPPNLLYWFAGKLPRAREP